VNQQIKKLNQKIFNKKYYKYIIIDNYNNIMDYPINTYIIVNDKFLGKIIQQLNVGIVIKLDNDDKHIDFRIKQLKLFDKPDGYLLATLNDKIEPVSITNLSNFILNDLKTEKFIHIDNLISNNLKHNILKGGATFVPLIPYDNPQEKYANQNLQEDDYIIHMTNMIKNLFTDDSHILYEEHFNHHIESSKDAEKNGTIDENTKNDVLAPLIMENLRKYNDIEQDYYYDFEKTLVYKHIVSSDYDIESYGKQMIKIIKNKLLKLQENITFDGYQAKEITSIFGFIKFTIANGYIIITDVNQNNDNIITPELVPNLIYLKEQYNKPINHVDLVNIILENAYNINNQDSNNIVQECINILSQEYIICLQPKVNFLCWAIIRLLLLWYADPKLSNDILKIKILINLYHSRPDKDFNNDYGQQPIIMIIPRYGKANARYLRSTIEALFSPYIEIGLNDNILGFNQVNKLIYSTNGSLDLKRYLNYLVSHNINLNIDHKFNNNTNINFDPQNLLKN